MWVPFEVANSVTGWTSSWLYTAASSTVWNEAMSGAMMATWGRQSYTDASKFTELTPSGPSCPVRHGTFLRALLTCSSVPSAVTMVTEWAPCVASSWAGMVMVVPSWVTMVIVPPIACKSASEILTWRENGVFSVRGTHSATAPADLHWAQIFTHELCSTILSSIQMIAVRLKRWLCWL